MSKYTDMSNELLKLIGGKDNVASVTHCATRPVSYTHLTLPTTERV